ncbi:VOC family protein [Bacteroidales bacterium]|nr:VOC family protein [Bacteroidales bacterium]
MVIDHICIAVKDVDAAIKYWGKVFGYTQMTEVVLNTKQKVLVAFVEKENSTLVKLIQPSDDTSPLNNFMKKGGGFHHICFKTDDKLEEKVVELKANGLIPLVPPQTGEAFDNNLIAFMFGRGNLNVEVIDTDIKAKRIKK